MKNEQSLRDLWDIMKCTKNFISAVTGEFRKEQFTEIMAENFSNLIFKMCLTQKAE